MKVRICAVGRQRAGPERDLTRDYLTRFERAGRALGLGPATLVEVENRKGGGIAGEAVLLERAAAGSALKVVLDERGQVISSPDFARRLAGWRDGGRGAVAFLIGGADGLAPELRQSADFKLSFGKMVWPHMLVRVMLAEQLYRAAMILAHTPYHRA